VLWWCPSHIVLRFFVLFVLVLCLDYPMLPVSPDCPLLITLRFLLGLFKIHYFTLALIFYIFAKL